ncbi:hypothetical protein CORC01_05255 [Colletotrichum orchidophilum]|uniref:Uncharacterized protein n=1 Tax=Colletotrichum orchidophilum TaxID=1209926 RepID=A0A1G4BDQ9_9PEZI|nr:uncharacterized protein CORC01_05255 [Colletotrichum orchidophilum]OHE99455.1 hypothetical protein CORC01_05255 [Colletotrichum orchidophilum]
MAATATTAAVTASISTNTHQTVVVTSFPFNPLTTQFAQPTQCDGIYYGDVYMVDPQDECLPTSLNKQETAYFSPGYVCPQGYMTAKVDNIGVHSITTVTCCPYRSDIILSAVDPATLAGQWANLFCTWIAPEATRIDITHTDDGRTWTEQALMTPPGGVNAYGVRMVYQSSDVEFASATAASGTDWDIVRTNTGLITGTAATARATASGSSELSTGAAVAIAAVVPVVFIGLVAGIAFWWWRKRRAERYNRMNGNGPPQDSIPNQSSTMNQTNHVHQVPNMQQQYQQYQQQQQPAMQNMQAVQSPSSTYQSSLTAAHVHQHPHTQQYRGYKGYAGSKLPNLSEGESSVTGQNVTPTSELAAPVPLELPNNRNDDSHEYRTITARGQHIDHQKMMGMGPLK